MSFEIIDKLNREFEVYYNNGQMKEAVAVYENDARVFAADKKVYQGLNQIEKVYSDSISNGNTKVILHTGQIIQCGYDYIIEISSYKLNNEAGNYVVLWKQIDGQWKKIVDIFN